jgi:hypothetical protein
VLQHTREKGNVGSGGEAAFLHLIKETPAEIINQPKDFIAFPLAGGLDFGLLTAPRPGVRRRAPLRERRFIAKQQQGLPLVGKAQNLGPRCGAPRYPLACIKMSGDKGRFLIAKAQVLQQLGDVEDVVEEAEAVVNHLLDHGRRPAGTPETGLERSLVNQRRERLFLRRGPFGRAASGLFARRARDPIAVEHANPGHDGLLVHTQDQGDLCKALAVPDAPR